jgi:7-cyano-7-deazaguanine synthase
MKAVAILSGGADSSTLCYWLKANGFDELSLITFNYGQRHIKELNYAERIANDLNAKLTVIDISNIRPLLKGSSLTDESVDTPHEQYDKKTMQLTVVPNRNAIMLSIAWSYACTELADVLACGVHAGDHYLYPDCRIDFINMLNLSLRLGTEDHRLEHLMLIAPFIGFSKSDIIKTGSRLFVPFHHTWSCYEGKDIHCGLCGSCRERKKGFIEAGVDDPTEYAA